VHEGQGEVVDEGHGHQRECHEHENEAGGEVRADGAQPVLDNQTIEVDRDHHREDDDAQGIEQQQPQIEPLEGRSVLHRIVDQQQRDEEQHDQRQHRRQIAQELL